MIEAIDSKKSLSPISLLEAMKMLVRAWDEVTEKTVQNCFKEAEFSEIEDDDTVSDDPFAALKDSINQFSILDKIFEDITAKNVASFDDILVSTLSNLDVLADLLAVDIDNQHESNEDSSQSEVLQPLIQLELF